jgi:hypothetical protein
MRNQTVLNNIQQLLHHQGISGGDPAVQYIQLFQEAIETATGAEKHLDAVMISSALMFAGAEIGHNIRQGLAEIAGTLDRLADRE